MYNIGLDIGTGSVGWCLTDENGYLLKVNRKGNNGNTYKNSAWGVRLFESADTAADCRIKRSTRNIGVGYLKLIWEHLQIKMK